MKRHINVPIFIPHLGCPNQCVFCNQRTITGVKEFEASEVRGQIETALATVSPETEAEIAFFGGSFTGIGEERMTELLSVAYEFVRSGRVVSVRCSTRPDYITPEILDILISYGVKTVELGLQSVDEGVLSITKRGHSFADEERAARLITERGIELVGQMMIGLPGSSLESELATARFIVNSGATGARIYPTVTFYGTELQKMAERGEYTPVSLDDAVKRAAAVLKVFIDGGVQVIRIGLSASEELSDPKSYYAGPNHSALGELVIGEYYYNLISEKIKPFDISDINNSRIIVEVARGATSKAIGQNKRNKLRLADRLHGCRITFVECDSLGEFEVRIRQEERIKECT